MAKRQGVFVKADVKKEVSFRDGRLIVDNEERSVTKNGWGGTPPMLNGVADWAGIVHEVDGRVQKRVCVHTPEREVITFRNPESADRGSESKSTSEKFLSNKLKDLCGLINRYTTTIHTINSCVVKLSKLTKVKPVFRGISSSFLPEEFFLPNEFAACGVVEFGFFSTTTKSQVAEEYASGAASTLMKLEPGFVDRGASIAWLSQYPTEEEVLFPPLLALHILDVGVNAHILEIHARPSINLKAQTLEQVANRRKQVVDDMSTSLRLELRNTLRLAHGGGEQQQASGEQQQADLLDTMLDHLCSEPREAYLLETGDRALGSAIDFGVSAHRTAGAMREGLERMRTLVLRSTKSADLNLSGQKLGDADVGSLSQLLSLQDLGLRELRSINLSRNGMCEVGGWLLFEAMGKCKLSRLCSIDVSHNRIGDRALAKLAAIIEAARLPHLQLLNLWSNAFTDEGLSKLADALAAERPVRQQHPCPNLQSVEFEFNEITNVGRNKMQACLSSFRVELSSGTALEQSPLLMRRSSHPLHVAPAQTAMHLPERYMLCNSILITKQIGHVASGENSDDVLWHKGVDEMGTLEDVIGAPMNQLLEGMRREHCMETMDIKRRGFDTTAEIEWFYVTDPLLQRTLQLPKCFSPMDGRSFVYPGTPKWWERNQPDAEKRPTRIDPSADTIAYLAKQLRKINAELNAADVPTLLDAEFYSARLFTGPMGDVYRNVLQRQVNVKLGRKTSEASSCLSKDEFTTTIHVLSSAILKLSKIARHMTIYASLSPEDNGLARSVFKDWQADALSATVITCLSATSSGELAFRNAAESARPIVFQMKLSPSSQLGADLSWLSQYPAEEEVALPPLVRLHVCGRRTMGSVDMVKLSVQPLLTLRTVEQMQCRMQQMHLEMLTLVESNCRNAGMPGGALAMLQQIRDNAKMGSARWYNSHSNFRQATKVALEKQQQALQMMAQREIWEKEVQHLLNAQNKKMKESGSLIPAEFSMQQAAELASDLEEHEVAIHILRMWLEEQKRFDGQCEDLIIKTVKTCKERSIDMSPDDLWRLRCVGYALLFKHAEQPWPATLLKLVGDANEKAESRITQISSASDTVGTPRSNTSGGYTMPRTPRAGKTSGRVAPIPSATRPLLDAFCILVRNALDAMHFGLNDAASGRAAASFFIDPFDVGSTVFVQHVSSLSEGAFTTSDEGKELRIAQGDVTVGGEPRSVRWKSVPADVEGVIESVQPIIDGSVKVRVGGNDGLLSSFTSRRMVLPNPRPAGMSVYGDWARAKVTRRRLGRNGHVEIDTLLSNGSERTALRAGGSSRDAVGTVHVLGICDDGPGAMLRLAAKEGRAQLVKALLDAGISPDVTESTCTSMPLLDAASNGHEATCRVLIDRGVR